MVDCVPFQGANKEFYWNWNTYLFLLCLQLTNSYLNNLKKKKPGNICYKHPHYFRSKKFKLKKTYALIHMPAIKHISFNPNCICRYDLQLKITVFPTYFNWIIIFNIFVFLFFAIILHLRPLPLILYTIIVWI